MITRLLLTYSLMVSAVGALSAQTSPDDIRVDDYRPRSIYKVPVSKTDKARYPAIDIHSHPYAKSDEALKEWVKVMDNAGIAKTIVMTMSHGAKFDSLYAKYAAYGDRFEVWCGFDYTGYQEPGW